MWPAYSLLQIWKTKFLLASDRNTGENVWGLRGSKTGENCVMRSFMVFSFKRYFWWSNEGVWDGCGMWHAWGRREMYTGNWSYRMLVLVVSKVTIGFSRSLDRFWSQGRMQGICAADSDSLLAGRAEVLSSVGGTRFYGHIQTDPAAHPSSCTVGTVSLSRG